MSKYLKLQRAQKGSVTDNWDLNSVTGQHGEGVYCFLHGDKPMADYYSKDGCNVHSFKVLSIYVNDLSKSKMDFWEAKTFIFNNPQYKAFIFKHSGHGIPTSKEV